MSYITTNIRLPKEDYLKLKEEAIKEHKSLAAIIREKISAEYRPKRSPEEIKRLLEWRTRIAKKNANALGTKDSATVVREMRDNAKW